MKGNKETKSNKRSLMERMDTFNDEDDLFDPFGNFFKDIPRLGNGFSNFFNHDNQMKHFEHHFKSMNSNSPGTTISKSYVSSVQYNENGEPERETYQSQSVNQRNEDGHTIKENQEAYHNSVSGVEKASRMRLLDGKGHKCVKERNKNTGDQNEHNMFKGIEEENLEEFNNHYDEYRKKIDFQKNYDMLKQMKNTNKRLGQGNRSEGGNRNHHNLLGSDIHDDFRVKF